MPRPLTTYATLTIASGQTTSPAVVLNDDVYSLMVYAPATLTGTVTMQVSPDGVAFATLQSGGADITFPAGKAVSVFPTTFRQLRLVSSQGEGAARDFSIQVRRPV